jgi:hypothetical protein
MTVINKINRNLVINLIDPLKTFIKDFKDNYKLKSFE